MPDRTESTVDDNKLLIVEDEPRLRELLVRAVPDMGCRPTGVGSAEQALAVMEQDPHGIILLDLNLPVMNGIEAMSIVRERWPETGVIIMTGFGDLEAAQQAIRLGVVDFLSKPCSLGDLERAIDRARRRRPRRGAPGGSLPMAEAAFAEAEAAERQAVEAAAAGEADAFEVPEIPAADTPALSLAEIERRYILAAVARHGGNREAAASELGISVRKLYYRLSQYQKSASGGPADPQDPP